MRHLKNILLVALLALAACKGGNGARIPPEKMEKVLIDIQLAEVYASMAGRDSTHNSGLRNNDSLVAFYREVLAHHQVSLQDFKQSLDWYRQHPDKLNAIYEATMQQVSDYGKWTNK